MFRKHFIKIARAISEITSENERREVALTCCAAFEVVNPRFNRSRFLEACAL
jgi:hypothetical protein